MNNKLSKDNAIVFSTQILIYMKGLFLMPIIIKTLGVSTYGTFILISTFVGILGGLSSLGVGTKSFRYLPSAKSEYDKAQIFYPPFYFKLFILIFISIIIVIFEKRIKLFFIHDDLTFSIYILPLYLLFYLIYEYSHNYLRYTSRIFYMSLLDFGYAYLHVFFILFYSNKIGLININILFLSQSFVALFVAIPVLFLIFKEINFNFIFFKLNEIKEEIKIGLPIVLNLVVDYILATSDRFILAYFMGAIAVGLYVPAYTLGALILLVPKAIGTVVPQLMSKSVDNDDFLEAKKIFLHSIKIFMILTIPFIFGIYLIGYDILILLANDEVADNGKYIATIIAISSFFYGFNILMSQANMVDLKTVVIFKANFLAGIFNLISTFIGFYFIHSIYVPAITTVLSFMIATIYFYKTIESKWLDNSIFFLFIKVLMISILMFIFVNISMVFLPELSMVMSIIIKILLALIIYFPLVILLKIL